MNKRMKELQYAAKSYIDTVHEGKAIIRSFKDLIISRSVELEIERINKAIDDYMDFPSGYFGVITVLQEMVMRAEALLNKADDYINEKEMMLQELKGLCNE